MTRRLRLHYAEALYNAREQSIVVLAETNEALERRARRRKRSGSPQEDIENEIDLIIAQQESERLAAIDRALGVLREAPAEYGVCAICGEAIDRDRLDIAPWSSTCAAHEAVASVVA
jgi:RNA polymerase-binding transcription factor DksA